MDNCLLVIGFTLHLTSASTYNQHWPVTDDWHKPQTEWHQPHQHWPEPQEDSDKSFGEWHKPQDHWQHSQSDWHDHHGEWQEWLAPHGELHAPHGELHAPHGEWHTPHGDWHQSHTDWHKPHGEYHKPHGDHHKPHGECHESHEEGHNSHGSHGEHHNSHSNHGYQPQGPHQWNTHEYANFNLDEKYRTHRSFEFPVEESETPNPILILECLIECPFSQKLAPVCGTNKFTYGNIGKLLCAKKCGVAVDLLHMGPCSDTSGTGTTVSEIPVVSTTTPQVNTEQCMSTCPRTSEFNPVCGTNYVLYENVGAFECARRCGLNVQLLKQGICPLPPTPNPTPEASQEPNSLPVTSSPRPINPMLENPDLGTGNPVTSDPVKPNISQTEQCLASCTVSSENNPVCGTDLVIYQNISKLRCVTKCGADVALLKVGTCPGIQPVVKTTVKPIVPPELSFDVRVNVENNTATS